jgi:hypothetical protein
MKSGATDFGCNVSVFTKESSCEEAEDDGFCVEGEQNAKTDEINKNPMRRKFRRSRDLIVMSPILIFSIANDLEMPQDR